MFDRDVDDMGILLPQDTEKKYQRNSSADDACARGGILLPTTVR
jgi:hypothetical protein